MDLVAYLVLDVPFILVVYLAVLLFVRPGRVPALAALLGGLAMAVINMLADLLAYYLHLWHYTLSGLVLHLPLPFYIPDVFIYGGIGYLAIWILWQRSRWQWAAIGLLVAIPLVRMLFDYARAATASGYIVWDSPLASFVDLIQYLIAFYLGYLLFTLCVRAYLGHRQ
uniref:Uncharacterized protein n=1 Tax=Thermogemmatispora argillosa TaxID=2045280 RepID=A0A455T552_9CHLR|nr:hypothetical protein KTA_26980 [Thermogemmatispora argillosa]